MSLYGEPIDSFSGEYRFLSNFSPAKVWYGGILYPTVENAYQAAKSIDFDIRLKFLDYPPSIAKHKGRKLKIRSDWEKQKLNIMWRLIDQKFDAHELRRKLIDTGDRPLIEGNTWGDTYWGQCPVGHGCNNLGKLLMKKRAQLQNDLT